MEKVKEYFAVAGQCRSSEQAIDIDIDIDGWWLVSKCGEKVWLVAGAVAHGAIVSEK